LVPSRHCDPSDLVSLILIQECTERLLRLSFVIGILCVWGGGGARWGSGEEGGEGKEELNIIFPFNVHDCAEESRF